MKIPVTIVTGFLGSGKTTLISNLLKKVPERRLAVLVNEFGEVSIDGALLRTTGQEIESEESASGKKSGGSVEIIDLPNGCICCTVQDDFLPAMRGLQKRKGEIEHVMIETSGLALPTPVMRALSWPEIRNDFQLDAVITVVDVPDLLAGSLQGAAPIPGVEKASEETRAHLSSVEAILREQLENADVVVLNKIDELDEAELLRAEEMVRAVALKVRFLELAYHAELDTRLCMGLKLHEEGAACQHHHHGHGHGHHHGPVSELPDESFQPLEDQEQFDGHAHSGISAHAHGEHTHQHFHEHDTGWQSFVLHTHSEQEPETLKKALKEVALAEPILRAKGFVAQSGKEQRLVVQAVRSRVQTYYDRTPVAADETKASVVFIGYHPNRENCERLMNELTGVVWH